MKIINAEVSKIKVGKRFRRDLGDIQSLATSMEKQIIHPIAMTPNYELLVGVRRLAAARHLEWQTIPACIIENSDELLRRLEIERDENTERKALTPNEGYAMDKALEALFAPEVERAKEEGRNKGASAGGKTAGRGRPKKASGITYPKGKRDEEKRMRAKKARAVGISPAQWAKLDAIKRAIEITPAVYGDLEARLDKPRSINAAYKEFRKRVKRLELEREATEAKNADIKSRIDIRHCKMQELLAHTSKIDAIITDPPYKKDYLELYEILAKLAISALKRNGILAVMCGQSYLPDILSLMAQHIKYRWTMAYLTPGGQAVQLWTRKINTFWKPILLFGGIGGWVGDVIQSAVNDNDKSFHEWGQSLSGTKELIEKLTKPGDLVCDPFLGAGTTALACFITARRFVGCDVNPQNVQISEGRIASESNAQISR